MDHVNGKESDGARENLMWACKSCNATKAHLMKKVGLGERVAQYNPKASKHSQMEEYAAAIKVMRGTFEGDVAKAVAVIRATPPEIRSAYTARTWKTRRSLYGPAGRGNMAHRKRNLFGLGKRTYSAATKISRPVLRDKKAERKLRKIEAREAARLKRIEGGSVRPKAKATAKQAGKMPSLFGTAYEKLSPSQQALVQKAMAHNRKNPGKSFAACVKAVSKRGVTSPAAVCAASKMRTEKGKRELLAAAKRGKLMAHSKTNPFETMTQGSAKADLFQVGPHQFVVVINGERKEFKSFKAAQMWARLRLHEVANPKGVKVRVYKQAPTNRKNPMDSASKMYEEFHGFPSEEVIKIVEQVHYHSVTWSIGPLVSLIVRFGKHEPFRLRAPDPASAKVEDIVFLSCTEDGRQLIPAGGEQGVKVDDLMGRFGLNQHDVRDHMVLGEILQLTYRTRKSFEADGEEEIDFYHDLGKEHSRGVLPTLIYKPRNPSLEIAGGRYFIGKPERALGNVSPGIVG